MFEFWLGCRVLIDIFLDLRPIVFVSVISSSLPYIWSYHFVFYENRMLRSLCMTEVDYLLDCHLVYHMTAGNTREIPEVMKLSWDPFC